MIERRIWVQVEPTPYELAKEFCEMDADKQADFLNFIADISEEWNGSLQDQVQNIVDSPNFHSGGNKIMKMFGEYAK